MSVCVCVTSPPRMICSDSRVVFCNSHMCPFFDFPSLEAACIRQDCVCCLNFPSGAESGGRAPPALILATKPAHSSQLNNGAQSSKCNLGERFQAEPTTQRRGRPTSSDRSQTQKPISNAICTCGDRSHLPPRQHKSGDDGSEVKGVVPNQNHA